MSALDFGLRFVGMPENEIADLKAGLPTLSAIVEEAQELEPVLEKALPHLQALVALWPEAAPVLQKMWPQIVAETPLLKEMIEFARSKA